MNFKTLVLCEDDPLAIMYYELWCNKFSVQLLLYKNFILELFEHSLDLSKVVILDLSLIQHLEDGIHTDVFSKFLMQPNVFITTGFSESLEFMKKPIYSKTEVLKKFESSIKDLKVSSSLV